ncbi:MAG: DNA-protecting protein DprA [Deltaproteobacteria bacterium]|nr:DNA-protecting protein DprA [Deltaproteobacteria bacterium]
MEASDPMPFESASLDILLRLCQVEGFTVRHLRSLRQESRYPCLPEMEGGDLQGILRKGIDALTSTRAGEKALGIREACCRGGIRIVPFGSGDYPPLLRGIPDAPPVLFLVGGNIALENSVAIVGSRSPTDAAVEFAGLLASDLACAGWTIVSGMARGIDAAAHEGALRGGGTTLAVLGCGVDIVYPPQAAGLRTRILRRGGLLSEYPPGTKPLPYRFPARNRIISGVSRGVVVVEAAARSGALITARIALEQGREVMAVPGNPIHAHTAGSNRLIRDGAIPVTGAEDVVAALGWIQPVPPSGSRERRIMDFLDKARRVDDIAEALDIPPQELLPCLLEMEMAKLLERGAGDYYKKASESPGGISRY